MFVSRRTTLSALCISFLCLAPLASCGAQTDANDAPAEAGEDNATMTPATDDEKTLYALGLVLAQNVKPFNLSEEEADTVIRGLRDALSDAEPEVDLQEYGPRIQQFAQGRMAAAASAEREAGEAFLTQASSEASAETTDSGLVFTEIEAGSGASPTAQDTVRVHYHGTLRNGTVFDSSVDRDEPVEFQLGQVIPCWQEGLQRMQVGGKAKLVCPPEIAYGDQGRPPAIPGGAVLVFDVELLDIPSSE